MAAFADSLRGYGHRIHQRYDYVCQYCGLDGKKSFDAWATLSVDHLLPRGHPDRDNEDYMVTACNFCNTADNHYFTKYGLSFENMTPEELVEQRKQYVQRVRDSFYEFWKQNVKSASE